MSNKKSLLRFSGKFPQPSEFAPVLPAESRVNQRKHGNSLFFSLLAGNSRTGDGFEIDCVRHHLINDIATLSFIARSPGKQRVSSASDFICGAAGETTSTQRFRRFVRSRGPTKSVPCFESAVIRIRPTLLAAASPLRARDRFIEFVPNKFRLTQR